MSLRYVMITAVLCGMLSCATRSPLEPLSQEELDHAQQEMLPYATQSPLDPLSQEALDHDRSMRDCTEQCPEVKSFERRVLSCACIDSVKHGFSFIAQTQEGLASSDCAELFALTLHPDCTTPVFMRFCATVGAFSIHQVFCAIQSYYKGDTPETEKIQILIDHTPKILSGKILSNPGGQLSTFPWLARKNQAMKEEWEKETFSGYDHKFLWITEWSFARRMLRDTYRGALEKKDAPYSHVFHSKCPSGAFNPHKFLKNALSLDKDGPSKNYIFYHMEEAEFSLLAYAWCPALCHPETRHLLRSLLTRILPSDPEKIYMKNILEQIAAISNKYLQNTTRDGCQTLIADIWALFDKLQAPVSHIQWGHSVRFLKDLEGVEKHITDNPELEQFRKRELPETEPIKTKSLFCVEYYLSDLYAMRHRLVTRQWEELKAYKTLLLQKYGTAYTSTQELMQSYTCNSLQVNVRSSLNVCALLNQQSALLQVLSFMRASLLSYFDREKGDAKKKYLEELHKMSHSAEEIYLAKQCKKIALSLDKSCEWTPLAFTQECCGKSRKTALQFWKMRNKKLTKPTKEILREMQKLSFHEALEGYTDEQSS